MLNTKIVIAAIIAAFAIGAGTVWVFSSSSTTTVTNNQAPGLSGSEYDKGMERARELNRQHLEFRRGQSKEK